MSSEPQTRTEEPNGQMTPFSAFIQPEGAEYWCSIPADTPEGRMARYAAREGEAEQGRNVLNTEIVIQDLLLHSVTIRTEDGEVKDLLRAVMILSDGRMVGSCSTGIVGCLQTACREFGRPPWRPGFRFKVISIGISNGRQTFKLLPAFVISTKKEGKA